MTVVSGHWQTKTTTIYSFGKKIYTCVCDCLSVFSSVYLMSMCVRVSEYVSTKMSMNTQVDSKLHGNLSDADSVAKNKKKSSYNHRSKNGSLASYGSRTCSP